MTPQPEQQASTNRRTIALGVGAGLLAGGAIGLMVVMPGFTSAAGDTNAQTVGIVVEQDAEPTPPADDTRREPGTRLRETLQDLVEDGTLTSAQADAVTEHLVENRPDRGDRGHHGRRGHRPGAGGEAVADLLGIDEETLRDELRSGSSIADIAADNGVDVQDVIDALVAQAGERLDLAVENGRLTAEEAAEMAERLEERITARVNGERPDRPSRTGVSDSDLEG